MSNNSNISQCRGFTQHGFQCHRVAKRGLYCSHHATAQPINPSPEHMEVHTTTTGRCENCRDTMVIDSQAFAAILASSCAELMAPVSKATSSSSSFSSSSSSSSSSQPGAANADVDTATAAAATNTTETDGLIMEFKELIERLPRLGNERDMTCFDVDDSSQVALAALFAAAGKLIDGAKVILDWD